MSESNRIDAENPFWEFSLKFYGQDGVASSCLALQDSFDADVNIVLYCCWVAQEGAQELAPAELAEIITAIRPWQSGVVQRLRQIRRDMKQEEMMNFGALSEPLRQTIKECELEGEKIEQTILYQSGQSGFSVESMSSDEKAQNAAANLSNYLKMICGDVPENAADLIQIISRKAVA